MGCTHTKYSDEVSSPRIGVRTITVGELLSGKSNIGSGANPNAHSPEKRKRLLDETEEYFRRKFNAVVGASADLHRHETKVTEGSQVDSERYVRAKKRAQTSVNSVEPATNPLVSPVIQRRPSESATSDTSGKPLPSDMIGVEEVGGQLSLESLHSSDSDVHLARAIGGRVRKTSSKSSSQSNSRSHSGTSLARNSMSVDSIGSSAPSNREHMPSLQVSVPATDRSTATLKEVTSNNLVASSSGIMGMDSKRMSLLFQDENARRPTAEYFARRAEAAGSPKGSPKRSGSPTTPKTRMSPTNSMMRRPPRGGVQQSSASRPSVSVSPPPTESQQHQEEKVVLREADKEEEVIQVSQSSPAGGAPQGEEVFSLSIVSGPVSSQNNSGGPESSDKQPMKVVHPKPPIPQPLSKQQRGIETEFKGVAGDDAADFSGIKSVEFTDSQVEAMQLRQHSTRVQQPSFNPSTTDPSALGTSDIPSANNAYDMKMVVSEGTFSASGEALAARNSQQSFVKTVGERTDLTESDKPHLLTSSVPVRDGSLLVHATDGGSSTSLIPHHRQSLEIGAEEERSRSSRSSAEFSPRGSVSSSTATGKPVKASISASQGGKNSSAGSSTNSGVGGSGQYLSYEIPEVFQKQQQLSKSGNDGNEPTDKRKGARVSIHEKLSVQKDGAGGVPLPRSPKGVN